MEFLGVSGVEDKLQDEVAITIESLRNAGIKVWMLTGDKVATAKCIAVVSGIKTHLSTFYEITSPIDELTINNRLQNFVKLDTSKKVILIDGGALGSVMNSELNQKLFFEATSKASGVICCRCAPKQKAKIVEFLQFFTGKRVAGIGDGGNDVGMI